MFVSVTMAYKPFLDTRGIRTSNVQNVMTFDVLAHTLLRRFGACTCQQLCDALAMQFERSVVVNNSQLAVVLP